MALSAENLDRIVKLLLLTTSSNDAEALSALRRAQHIAGSDFFALIYRLNSESAGLRVESARAYSHTKPSRQSKKKAPEYDRSKASAHEKSYSPNDNLTAKMTEGAKYNPFRWTGNKSDAHNAAKNSSSDAFAEEEDGAARYKWTAWKPTANGSTNEMSMGSFSDRMARAARYNPTSHMPEMDEVALKMSNRRGDAG
ncbi:hypothetical protein [Methylocystis sp. ATCC 49242]|uniref:hypothetical protein n=1 Tax=Methylocystis sp. ATCC 49242 TaxID=622637 RepID=UPI00118567A4|nr:hypothetical protein [Methylocystis sp. ATCC 49242]